MLTTNHKLAKSVPGFLLMGLSLAPADVSGYNVCPSSSEGCRAACLFTAGRGPQSNVRDARIGKTKLFFEDRPKFLKKLVYDIETRERRAKKNGLKLALRLNTISDLSWESIKYKGKSIPALFPDVAFYDYTKRAKRAIRALTDPKWPANYHLTFSRSETNGEVAKLILEMGGNVAVVFRKPTPKRWGGYKVVCGDQSDARFLDPKGVVVGLKAKGDAKKDMSGFVV